MEYININGVYLIETDKETKSKRLRDPTDQENNSPIMDIKQINICIKDFNGFLKSFNKGSLYLEPEYIKMVEAKTYIKHLNILKYAGYEGKYYTNVPITETLKFDYSYIKEIIGFVGTIKELYVLNGGLLKISGNKGTGILAGCLMDLRRKQNERR